MNNWKRYKNGNYTVSINLDNGTKIRENDLDNLTPAFAENCDVTISTVCDGGCEWCYMNCTPDGKHGDIMNPKFLDTLHEWTELAINGNDLTHPDLIPFLEKMKKKNIIVNMTVNQKHFEAKQDMIKKLYSSKLIHGLGVSLVKPTYEFIKLVKQYPNAVIHTIAGVTNINDYRLLAFNDLKILILGYKDIGRGKKFYEENYNIGSDMTILKAWLKRMVDGNWFNVISFDNLALEQLNVKRFLNLTDDEWNEFYMGSDGNYTFFVDLVEKKFAKNSMTSDDEKHDLLDNVDDMFQVIRKEV
nr:MAG TPA: Molybdenum cofactor biosynthesis protein A barrel, LIGAND BINDING PROTEIN [Caudoviricetes sp.]